MTTLRPKAGDLDTKAKKKAERIIYKDAGWIFFKTILTENMVYAADMAKSNYQPINHVVY